MQAHPVPVTRQKTAEARNQIIEVYNQPKYVSEAPFEIVPDLADKGTYIASESTFYRVLREEKCKITVDEAKLPKLRNRLLIVQQPPIRYTFGTSLI